MSAVELENFKESKQKREAASLRKRVAAMSAVELENSKHQIEREKPQGMPQCRRN
jgi:hypothetical protein